MPAASNSNQGAPCKALVAHLGHMLVLPTLQRGGPLLALSHFFLLWLLLVDHLPLLGHLLLLYFLLQIGNGKWVDHKRRKGGRAGKGWDPEVSLGASPLFLSAKSSFKLLFLFRAISSSSSELSSTRAIMNLREQTTKDLSSLPSESET